MKRYLISAFLVIFASFNSQAAVVDVIDITPFGMGDFFEARSGVSGTSFVHKDDGVTVAHAPNVAAKTDEDFTHNYDFSAVEDTTVALSTAVSNDPAIDPLTMEIFVFDDDPGVLDFVSISGPVDVSDTSVSLSFTMLATKDYRIVMKGDGTGRDDTPDYTLDVKAVPIPAAFLLFGTALMGLFGFQRNKGKSLTAAA